jgi:light-regulated signal transduction histidine kinase (bacteriophytochrome)
LITVENRSTQLRDAEGNVIGAVFVFQDVSERRKSEAEIQRLNRELQNKVNELTAVNKELSTFNYSVSHDLRGPLIAIDGFVRVLTEETSYGAQGENRKYLSVIKKNTRTMLQTIDDLLLFTRLSRSELEKQEFDIGMETQSVFRELHSDSDPHKIEFVVNELPRALGDHAMLRQVLLNLLSNAIKFTRFTESAHIEVGGTSDKTNCLYYVRDNGVGFSMTDVHRLFEVFQRLHSSSLYEGSGVGLAIAHRIIERHGGRMWAESSPNNGATFYFTLPRASG